jgi:hypothetical protein
MVEGALPALLRGDGAAHDLLVRQALLGLARRCDVIVLAQASTARVLASFNPSDAGARILSSPHLALREAAALLMDQKETAGG